MKPFLILSTLFFVQAAQALVLHVNRNDSVVYFHPMPKLELTLKETAGVDTGTLTVSLNYSSTLIQREFNTLVGQYRGYDVKISTATSANTVFALNLPMAGIYRELKLRQNNMGPYIEEQITLTADEKTRFSASKAAIEASVFSIIARTSYTSSVEVEKYETDKDFCGSVNAPQVKDMIFAIQKIEKPASIQHPQTFESLKSSLLINCFELESTKVKSFVELLQIGLELKPEGIARGSHFEKQSQEQFFEIQPVVEVSEAAAE